MKKRIHNIIFALLLGVVVGVTAYVLHARMGPGMWRYAIPATKEAQSKERTKSKTERMIESGELSNHEANYWKKIER